MNGKSTNAYSWARIGDLSILRLFALGLALAAATVVATIATRWLIPPAPSPGHDWILLKNALLPVLLLAVYASSVRLLEKRSPTELDARAGIILFPAGFAVGLTAVSGYVVALLMGGVAHLTDGHASADLLTLGNEFLVPWLTAVAEELFFRAVLFRLAEEMLGTTAAVALSAVLFSLSHAGNPGAGPAALLALALGLGVLLALAFAATRNLWFPIGLHMGWNLAEGFFYGLPNSGQMDPVRLASTAIHDGNAWTGGEFGPESSATLVALCLAISAILLVKTFRARRWVKRRLNLRLSTA